MPGKGEIIPIHRSLSFAAVMTVIVCLGGSIEAHGQLVAACPKAGTTTKGNSTIFGVATTTWNGADPHDPAICSVVTVNNNPTISGKTRSVIYGWYDLTTYKWANGEDQAKTGLRELLSGQKDLVVVNYTISMAGQSWVSGLTDTWKRTGKATLTIDGRPVEVITFQNDVVGNAGTPYASHFDVWYDPTSHLFVKAHQVAIRGSAKNNDSEVTSMHVP